MEIFITTKHEGKMKGMASINTSVLCNEQCRKNASIPNSVCSKCYARKFLAYRPNVRDRYEENYTILTTQIIPMEDLPFLNNAFFRIESFGDVGNVTQAINYRE